MILTKKCIRNTNTLRGLIKEGNKFTIGVRGLDRFSNVLRRVGFTDFKNGHSILPSFDFGPVSLFNAEGKFIKHKDRPMETAYRTIEWRWKEWHGPYDRIERSRLVDVPYKRYPRTFIEPPSIEFTIVQTDDMGKILVGPTLDYVVANEQEIVHAINLFLEIFGECQFFTEELDEINKLPVKKLNWKILPPGERPWPQLKKEVQVIINEAPKGNRVIIEYRLETINKYKPNFAAVGEGGFRGYIVLGFDNKNLYVFENVRYGNAMYLFDRNWRELSKKTKAEILNKQLQLDRIIHKEGWDSKIRKWLRNK